jgi:hypothetical protein
MEAGKEYIVVFMPTEQSALTNNAYMWLGQLQATRVGDMIEEVEDEQDTAGYYEFYHYDYPGQYLIHYKTEEELKAQIAADCGFESEYYFYSFCKRNTGSTPSALRRKKDLIL